MTNPSRRLPRRQPERHITEGSFFVADDRKICQSVGGQAVPVVYGGTSLRADGTMTGKRLAALVGLRDHARRVLQSQNEGWPEANRRDARGDLNRAYDRFVCRLWPDQQDHVRRDRRRQCHSPHAQPGQVHAKTRTPCWSCRWRITTR